MQPILNAPNFLGSLLLLGIATSSAAEPAAQPNPVISRCDQSFVFGFGSWEGAKTNFAMKPDGIHISAPNGQGGAGVAGISLDLAAFNDFTPALTLAVGERNKTTVLTLQLQDADGTCHNYKFNLRALKPGLAQKNS